MDDESGHPHSKRGNLFFSNSEIPRGKLDKSPAMWIESISWLDLGSILKGRRGMVGQRGRDPQSMLSIQSCQNSWLCSLRYPHHCIPHCFWREHWNSYLSLVPKFNQLVSYLKKNGGLESLFSLLNSFSLFLFRLVVLWSYHFLYNLGFLCIWLQFIPCVKDDNFFQDMLLSRLNY